MYVCLLPLALMTSPVHATVPNAIHFQGVATDASGSPLNGTMTIQLRIWRHATDTDPLSLLYEESHAGVPVADGVFSVALGTGTPSVGLFRAELFDSDSRWLEVVIDGEVLAPRQHILSVANALQCERSDRAAVALSLDGLPASAYQLRVTGVCPDGSSIQSIATDGSVLCSAPAPAGDITAVSAGNGLTGGGTSGDVSLSIEAGGIGYLELANDAVTSGKVVDESLEAADLAPGSVTSSEIAAGAVGEFDIATGAVGTIQIANSSIQAVDMGIDSVGASAIIVGAVASSEILDESLTSDDLGPDSVGASELAADSVGNSELAVNSVTGANVVDGTLTGADLAQGSVDADDIQDGSVDASSVADDSLLATDLKNEPGVEFAECDHLGSMSAGESVFCSITIDAPTAGYVVLHAALQVSGSEGQRAGCSISATDRHEGQIYSVSLPSTVDSWPPLTVVSVTKVAQIFAGEHTYNLVCSAFTNLGSPSANFATIVGTFVPTRY
jgi:hypothetical protein